MAVLSSQCPGLIDWAIKHFGADIIKFSVHVAHNELVTVTLTRHAPKAAIDELEVALAHTALTAGSND